MAMSSGTLYTLTFAVMLGFMVLVTAILFAISMLRQMHLHAQEDRLATNYHLSAAAIRRYIPLITAPTERVVPWYVRVDDTMTGIPKYTGAPITPGPVITPLRAQESLLYADTLAQPMLKTPDFPLSA